MFGNILYIFTVFTIIFKLIDYAELHCISNFTFLRGASHPEELVQQAHKLGYRALAITDECSVAGIVKAHIAAKNCNLHLIIGSEFLFSGGLKILILAKNNLGYSNLTRLITLTRSAAPKGKYLITKDNIENSTLTNCLFIICCNAHFGNKNDLKDRYNNLRHNFLWLNSLFPGLVWIATQQSINGFDLDHLTYLKRISKIDNAPLVATGNVCMHIRDRQKVQDVMTAIRLKKTIYESHHQLNSNSERHLRNLNLLRNLYPIEMLSETINIADQCSFTLDALDYSYPDEFTPESLNKDIYLRRLTIQGMNNRWPNGASLPIQAQIDIELELIKDLSYESYFLTVYDIVQFAKSQNILCQGRGSAANSVVCYCLGITEVDPTHINLLFERFLSRERNKPPDIDIDFEHERREEVVQYIYAKYGKDHAALTSAVVRYRPKSAIRDVSKALGLEQKTVDQLTKNISWLDGKDVSIEQLQEDRVDTDEPIASDALNIIVDLIDFPRHLSQHSGGFVLSHKPLCELVPIENASMINRTVIQWDKYDLEALGLLKIDCLGLGMLTAIHKSFKMIAKHHGQSLTMSTVPQNDGSVYKMISAADTIGVFQIESRAQMAMLPRLRPQCFYDLVIEIAIVRPGPIQGKMVHPYLKRRESKALITYPNNDIQQILGRTLGVPIFQEQVIRLAVATAGFTPGEADDLRRSISTWKGINELKKYKKKLINGIEKRGYGRSFAYQTYNQILAFGEYGFPESHAASFASIVYVSAWLKRHKTAIFTCAVLNSQPMGFYSISQLIQDAQRHGITINPIDVTISSWDCTLERSNHGDMIRLGLRLIKGLNKNKMEKLIKVRSQKSFSSIDDIAARAHLSQNDLQALAASDALKMIIKSNRRQAIWNASKPKYSKLSLPFPEHFEGIPLLHRPTSSEETYTDYANMGFTLGPHPLALLRTQLRELNIVTSADLYKYTAGSRVRVAGLTIIRQRPSSAKNVTFITIEDETGSANLIIWKEVAQNNRETIINAELLGALGIIQRHNQTVQIVVCDLFDYTKMLNEKIIQARSFR
ncbi:MAG: error-prone DNA polymerase [Acidiferrobacteraceae bacterium]|nr:error-prone DNA polymerase [Acidiferrobacteraceae bacterium]|tara:strand:- start:1309 stop:4470 length:3162 start_codon:yes stop_codon:yes gene_type:complete